MLETIIAGVDSRDGGRDALALAGKLADVAGADVIAARAYPYNRYPTRVPEHDAVLRRDAELELERDVADAGLIARQLVVDAPSAAEALHRVAERMAADLIVVGSTHHGRIGRVLIGDTAAGTLRNARCSVAVAPRGLHARGVPLGTIGVGFDGSVQSQSALDAALELARCADARLTLMAVVGLPQDMPVDGAFLEDIRERYRRQLDGLAQRAMTEHGVQATGCSVIGSPIGELAALSETVDVMVIGSPRPGPVHRLLVGRTGDRLVRRASCAVLVVRASGAMDIGAADDRGRRAASTSPSTPAAV